MSLVSKALSTGLSVLKKVGGECFTFRGSSVIGIPNTEPIETDTLYQESTEMPDTYMKILIGADGFMDNQPRQGEYIYHGDIRYSIVRVEYAGYPTNVFKLICSGDKKF